MLFRILFFGKFCPTIFQKSSTDDFEFMSEFFNAFLEIIFVPWFSRVRIFIMSFFQREMFFGSSVVLCLACAGGSLAVEPRLAGILRREVD